MRARRISRRSHATLRAHSPRRCTIDASTAVSRSDLETERSVADDRATTERRLPSVNAALTQGVPVDPRLARPAAPFRTIQLTRTGQPGPRHICTLTVALSTCPHTFRLLPHAVHDRILDPKRTHSHRAGTRPCAWPALPHRHPSCPAAPQTGTSRTILHPGQCSTSPPQPGAALRLIAPPLFGAALVHACLCTSLHRCTPRTAPLSMRSAAPCGWA